VLVTGRHTLLLALSVTSDVDRIELVRTVTPWRRVPAHKVTVDVTFFSTAVVQLAVLVMAVELANLAAVP